MALLFIGFAHKPPALYAHSIPASELSQYTLPDGSVPVLCLPSNDGKPLHGKPHFGSSCEVCRLTASVVLPTPVDGIGVPIRSKIVSIVPLRTEASYRKLFPPNNSPRAPPSDMVS